MAPSSSSSSSGASTSVQVALRIRPTTTQDTVSIPARFQRTVIHGTSSTSVTVDASAAAPTASGSATAVATPSTAAGKKQVFTFDQVHPSTVTQHSLFTSTAQPLISRFMEGFNCTILAYGQTSSGKTFTMTGVDLDADPSDPNNGMGIIPRAVSTIFSQARKLKEQRGGTWNYSIKGSFIEVYNEDLIDLLSSDEATGLRREVQIREGKDGSIIWGGLREVTVRNSTEVMHLIRQGTAIRRTNETDMNAQSSRSHAIFSLTLTQKKYTGSGVPPRSSSPLPPGGRSPSRLARPGSLYTGSSPNARVSSPTMGRPSTPSFQVAMGRGGGLRPASSLGLRPPDNRQDDDEGGEWTTIVSKFHFVDLAGSERLKRTAAAGERIKEGISINSGLLALGNVISALGDPSRAKSHTNSHVPYRDSKLTRLLQDSLGGNAHTLMIACVSPTEWNIGETVNTLKYANRARNIKNRAVVNEREDGWDDIEWLQGTVTRLRKEVKQLKEGGTIVSSTSPAVGEVTEGNSKKIFAQMTELQNNYESLREKYVERTEDLTRLRREVGERHRTSSGGTVGGTAKYEEIVGPVIEEYEKTISAMEAELGLNRAALRLTNDMMEEKEEELAQITERHSATELYVEELRTRLAKLTEREASTEAYVRDLEEKMKSCDETSMSSSESLTDLKREVSRYKEAESHSASYIADLEARLTRSDESVLTLQQTIERLESDCERRREEVEALTTRLENLSQDGASWRTDLEERERKVKELEQKMEAWERKRKEANEDRIRLGDVVGEVELAKRSLESLNGGSTKVKFPSTSGASTPAAVDLSIENQLVALRQTHAATLIDLSSVSKKYQDALQEIADLAAQIQEAKLSNPTIPETSAVDKVDTPPFRRRMTSSKSRDGLADPVYDAAGRRLFFRQAASVDSLHGRALLQSLPQSLSLSQELSSVRSREPSISSHGSSGSVSHSPSHRPNLSISLSSVTGVTTPSDQRSAVSMEKEIMRLQEVLREREAEISTLESSLKEKEQAAPTPVEPHAPQFTEADDLTHLSPKTIQKFDAVRKSMRLHHDLIPDVDDGAPDNDVDESLDRLNELMLSMAQKESQHKELVDSLHGQLALVHRAHDELTTLSRDQALNMSTELEGLRAKHHEDLLELETVKQREAELLASIKIAQESHAAELAELRSEHEDALRAKGIEIEELISRLKDEHETSLGTLRDQLSEASAALEKALKEHESAFGKLQAEHEEVLQRHSQEAKEILERTIGEHQHAMAKSKADHAEVLKSKDEQVATDLHRTEEEYYNALTKLRKDHTDALQRQATEAAAMLERLREDHASELRMSEKARECSLSESESSRDSALRDLQDEHAAAVARKEAAYAEDVEKLKTEHARLLSNKEEDYRARREHLKSEHATAMAVLREESEAQIEQLTKALARLEEETAATVVKLREEHVSATQVLTEEHAVSLLQITRGHQEEIARLKLSHTSELDDAVAKAQEEHTSLLTSHAVAIANLKSEHQMSFAEVQASLVVTQEKHASDLQESRTASERMLAEEQKRLATTVADLEQEHSDERDTLRKEQDRLRQELESHKVAILDIQEQRERGVLAERQRSQSAVTELEEKHSTERTTMRDNYESLVQELEAHKAAASDFVAVRAQYESAVSEQTTAMSSLEKRLAGAQSEKVDLQTQVTKLMAELEKTRSEQATFIQEASKRESLVDELDKHRSVIAEMQENLQRVKDEKDNLQVEKNKQETALRDMQIQIARTPIAQETSTPRATPDRNISFTRINGIASKLPPPTPPPSMPPPPAPKTQESQFSLSTQSSTMSSKDSSDSSATSVASLLAPSGPQVDSKAIAAKLEDQAKYIDEQEVMIKTLNKQLSHCESDLATHMDLVSTLETSLSDSEKNLRKARMQATELARERDSLNSQIEGLRNELQEARREVVTVRKSIVEEKQSLESRLDEERRAKERARAQLDSRMEELQKRKSKFACL